jgi:hypothetical protein
MVEREREHLWFDSQSLGNEGLLLFIINGEIEIYMQNLCLSRCDERLKGRVEESTYLTGTGVTNPST